MQSGEFSPPLRRIFSSRGDFSLGVNIDSDSIPQNLLGESINQGLVYAHMHYRESVLTGWLPGNSFCVVDNCPLGP